MLLENMLLTKSTLPMPTEGSILLSSFCSRGKGSPKTEKHRIRPRQPRRIVHIWYVCFSAMDGVLSGPGRPKSCRGLSFNRYTMVTERFKKT